jgi:hypothetical protein
MRTQQPTRPPPPSTSARRPLLLALVLTLLLIGGASAFLATRGSESLQSSKPSSTAAPAEITTTTLSSRSEVVARLQEILRIRAEAYRSRDANLLESIYTADCPCLESDRRRIQQLLRDSVIWRGVSTTIRVTKAEPVNDRLWIVTGIIDGAEFRIERESGVLVREVPKAQDLGRFALTRPMDQAVWLLGRASFIQRIE